MTKSVWRALVRGRVFDCALCSEGESGWRVELLRDGTVYASRRFTMYEEATRHAEQLRTDVTMADCARCRGIGWICEEHQEQPFPHDACAGPGEPCPVCNRGNPPDRQPPQVTFAKVEEDD